MSDQLLANVVDMDIIVSTNPLKFGLTSAFVQGPAAILRRILWRWCQPLGFVPHDEDLGMDTPLLDIDGATFSRDDLKGLRASLRKQAIVEAFVEEATIILSLSDAGLLTINALIAMTDGGTYPLEVQAIDAVNQLSGFALTPAQLAANVAALKAVFGV